MTDRTLERAAYRRRNERKPGIRVHQVRLNWLRCAYGLTEDAYVALLVSQDLRCGICREWLDLGKNTHVDHDHRTGKVRGILCGVCNKGLGQFQDSVSVLERAIQYLKGRIHA